MGTHTRDMDCPNCNNTAMETVDTKPFTKIYISCNECGFYMFPTIGFLTLDELNGQRNEVNDSLDDGDMKLEELAELPTQDVSL